MGEMDTLAEKIFALLKGNGLQIKIYDAEGAESVDPSNGRRFFVASPNLMVTIDEESNSVEFSKGASAAQNTDIAGLQKNVRKIANEFLLNFGIKEFGRAIEPRNFSYQAKMNKDNTMMENNSMQPHNHHLVGQILHRLKSSPGTDADTMAQMFGVTLSDIRPVLNKLVKEGKITVGSGFQEGQMLYSIAMDEAITESFSKMFGSLKTSQQTLENVRILVKHKTAVDENVRGSRSRHIGAIFLECNGERFRFQHTYLPGARAMAQHMAHGGSFGDRIGSYISENTGNLLKLQSFNRYVTTNKLINEDSSGIVETVKENIETIRQELRKLTGAKTYETAKARLETFEREALSEDDTSQLKDLFTIRRFDEKFEGVLPIIKQLVQEKDTFHKRIEEAAGNTVLLRREAINTTPMFEFAGENARLGFKLNEFALRFVENDELAGFVSKIGNKVCKEGIVNEFERAVLRQVFENAKVADTKVSGKTEIKESANLDSFFGKYTMNFF